MKGVIERTYRQGGESLVVLFRRSVACSGLLLLRVGRSLEPREHALDVDGVAVRLLGSSRRAHDGGIGVEQCG